MPEERLSLDEVKRIAKEFVRREWNAEVMEFTRIWLSPDYSLYEVDGRAGIHQQDMQTSPLTSLDTIIEFTFKLQISVKDSQVESWWREPPQSPRDFSSDKQRDRCLKDAQEARDRAAADYCEEAAEDIRDRRCKDKTDFVEEFGKKYGFDPSRFRP